MRPRAPPTDTQSPPSPHHTLLLRRPSQSSEKASLTEPGLIGPDRTRSARRPSNTSRPERVSTPARPGCRNGAGALARGCYGPIIRVASGWTVRAVRNVRACWRAKPNYSPAPGGLWVSLGASCDRDAGRRSGAARCNLFFCSRVNVKRSTARVR